MPNERTPGDLERDRLIAQLQRQTEEQAAVNRNKDLFLAQLGHELRNPLAPLLNAMHLLRLRGDDSTIREQVRELAERQVYQLARIVDDLLDVTRVARGKIQLRKESIDLAATVASAVETARPTLDGRGHQLTVVLPEEPVHLDADPSRLQQVLVNLLHNAAKYTEPGGHITLTAACEADDVVLRVRDTGIGLAPDMLDRVWDLWAQAEEARQHSQGGLGIGLSLVRGLVEAHGGKVQALSEGLGRGSEFSIRLPLRVAVAGAEAAVEPETLPVTGRTLRILVVDDDRDGAESLALLLRLWGYQVEVAHDGSAALEAARTFQPEIALLDLGLPGMGGHEVGRQLHLQQGLEHVRLVALTGYSREEDCQLSKESGFDDHLVKPVDLDALQRVLCHLSTRPRRNPGRGADVSLSPSVGPAAEG